MYINHSAALKNLRETLDNCETLYDILKRYTESSTIEDILDNLDCSDTIFEMADQNDMSSQDMRLWINDHLDSFVECRVFQEHGPAGGWPVVKVECLGMMFFLDWVV